MLFLLRLLDLFLRRCDVFRGGDCRICKAAVNLNLDSKE